MTDRKIDDKKMKPSDFFVINVSVKFFGLKVLHFLKIGFC